MKNYFIISVFVFSNAFMVCKDDCSALQTKKPAQEEIIVVEAEADNN